MAAPAARILLHALPWLLLAGCADPAAPRLGHPAAPDAPEAPAPGIGTPADASGAGPAAGAEVTIEGRLAAAESEIEAFKSEVSQTYATKTDFDNLSIVIPSLSRDLSYIIFKIPSL